jgi:hypothetical protein
MLAVGQATSAENHANFLSWNAGTKTLNLISLAYSSLDFDISSMLAFTTDKTNCGAYSVHSYSDTGRTSTTFADFSVKLDPNPAQSVVATGSLPLKLNFKTGSSIDFDGRVYTAYMKARTEGDGTNPVDTVDFNVKIKRCGIPALISADTYVTSLYH